MALQSMTASQLVRSLEEAEGLTVVMVLAWLNKPHLTFARRGGCWVWGSEADLKGILPEEVVAANHWQAVITIAVHENRTIQSLLREINIADFSVPDDEEIALYNGDAQLWIAEDRGTGWRYVGHFARNAFVSEKTFLRTSATAQQYRFYPCTAEGHRLPRFRRADLQTGTVINIKGKGAVITSEPQRARLRYRVLGSNESEECHIADVRLA